MDELQCTHWWHLKFWWRHLRRGRASPALSRRVKMESTIKGLPLSLLSMYHLSIISAQSHKNGDQIFVHSVKWMPASIGHDCQQSIQNKLAMPLLLSKINHPQKFHSQLVLITKCLYIFLASTLQNDVRQRSFVLVQISWAWHPGDPSDDAGKSADSLIITCHHASWQSLMTIVSLTASLPEKKIMFPARDQISYAS